MSGVIDPQRNYTAKEASVLLAERGIRLSSKSLLRMAGTTIPALRVGPNAGRVYFPGQSLLDYLRADVPAAVSPEPPAPRPVPARSGKPPDWRRELAEARKA